MLTVLLVKMSSMGDVIHNLPVVNDIRAHHPDATIHWVVEEGFASIPTWHSGVARVLPIALRRWRKSPTALLREWPPFQIKLRETNYDLIIDTQGLLKSALVARQAHGVRHGFSLRSAREPLATVFYKHRHDVARAQHAVTRNRQLAAQALGYGLPATVNFGLVALASDGFTLPNKPYAVLLHATSNAKKQWPQPHWIALAKELATRGITSVLPGGSAVERTRSKEIVGHVPSAVALPPLSLAELAWLITNAQIVIGVDTGLTHMAAALNIPVIAIFGASDPTLTGVYPASNRINLGGVGHFPDVSSVVRQVARLQ